MDSARDRDERTLTDALVALYISLDRTYAGASRDVELTPQQAQLLCIAEHERPALGQLAEAMGCDKTNVTGLVDRAAKRGLIERTADTHDRRVTRVLLTEEGRRLVARFHERLEVRLADIEPGKGVTPERIDAIADQLAISLDSPQP